MKKKELYIYTVTNDSLIYDMYTWYESLSCTYCLHIGKQSIDEYVIAYTYNSKLAKMYEKTRDMDNVNKYVFDYSLFEDECNAMVDSFDPYNMRDHELTTFKISSKTKGKIKVAMTTSEYEYVSSKYDTLELICGRLRLYLRGISAFKDRCRKTLDKFMLTTISMMHDIECSDYDDIVETLSYSISYGVSECNYDIKKFTDSIDEYIFMLWVYKDVFNIKKMMEVFE